MITKLLKLRPPPKEHDEGVRGINTSILSRHFIWNIVGKPYSGKTHLIRELITNPDFYAGAFNFIWLLGKPIEGLDLELNSNWVPTLDIDWIYDQIKKLQDQYEQKKWKKPINILIIFDDLVADIKIKGCMPKFIDLFMNRRHFFDDNKVPMGCISFIVVSQKYTLLPSRIRTQMTDLCFFKVNTNDFDAIKKEFIFEANSVTLSTMRCHLLQKDHPFVYLRDNGDIYCNFEKKISYQ